MVYEIEMTQRSDGMDVASWNGAEQASRNGASCKLARSMVDDGCEDAPVHLVRNGKVLVTFASLHAMATKTYTEGKHSARMAKFVPFDGIEGAQAAELEGMV